jgi:uncharacterized protein (TIGR02452 family)
MDEYNLSKDNRRNNLQRKKYIAIKKGVKKKSCFDDFIKEYNHTKKECFHDFDNRMNENSILYDIYHIEVDTDKEEMTIPDIEVKNTDSFDAAMDIEGNTLVLNMASNYKPGGGVKSGKTAQEECLFRRSNAFMTHPEDWYPLSSEHVIFSPSVTIIKDSTFKLLSKNDRKSVGMIAVSALRKPHLDHKGTYKYENDHDEMFIKIQSIFLIAIKHGFDNLVLGALGCGVFNNPPRRVAEMFRIMINSHGHYFKKIVFAVLCVKPKDYDNLRIFKEVLD